MMPPTHDAQILKKDVRWGEFRLDELFEIKTGGDVIIGKTESGAIPLISHQHENNGISKKITLLNDRFLFNANETIALADRGVFYATCQNTDFHIGTRVKALIFKEGEKSRRVRLFYVTAINKLQSFFEDYSNNATDKLPSLKIYLPVTINNKIDFIYMESYINKIENEYISKLENKRGFHLKSYLTVVALNDYNLSDEDKKILSFEPQWSEFKVGSLFDTIKRGKRIKSLDRIKGNLPFITAGINDRGFSSYIGNPEAEIFPANTLTIDMFGTVFYRGHEYGADDHVAVLHNKSIKYSKELLLYMGACIEKSIAGKFSYSRNFYASDAYDIVISLPQNADNFPDFVYMEAYIKAQQKLVITSMINRLDLEISATKHIIKK